MQLTLDKILEAAIDKVLAEPSSRGMSLCRTKLEEAAFWLTLAREEERRRAEKEN